jgi:dihydrofolate synthase/folylpolyglutamate synthase
LLSRGRVAELVPPGSEVWLDGGHNDDGGRVLAEAMAEFEEKNARPLVFVCGAQVTKDVRALIKHFVGLAREVVAVPVEGEHKSWPPQEIAALACAEGMRAAAAGSVEEALALVSRRSYEAPPRILIAGSLYLAAGVLALNGSVIE